MLLTTEELALAHCEALQAALSSVVSNDGGVSSPHEEGDATATHGLNGLLYVFTSGLHAGQVFRKHSCA